MPKTESLESVGLKNKRGGGKMNRVKQIDHVWGSFLRFQDVSRIFKV
jgi:hypothetical protein